VFISEFVVFLQLVWLTRNSWDEFEWPEHADSPQSPQIEASAVAGHEYSDEACDDHREVHDVPNAA